MDFAAHPYFGPGSKTKLTRVHWVLLGLCAALFVVLRLRWIGHLLVWDEAMTLCTVRAFHARAHDAFSGWFWRHPPLHTLCLLWLAPLKAGFAERAELFSICLGVLNQLLLFFLNRKVFGTIIALGSAFFLAVTPGSIFYDVWIKQDPFVVTFGLLALLFLFSRRPLHVGLCLGLAMLCKETAIFYVIAVFLLWCAGAAGPRTMRDAVAALLIMAVTCGWWYLIVVPKVSLIIPGQGAVAQAGFWTGLLHGLAAEHLRFAVGTQTGWEHDWRYYLTKWPGDIGWLGLVLATGGMILSCMLAARKRKDGMLDRVHLDAVTGPGRDGPPGRPNSQSHGAPGGRALPQQKSVTVAVSRCARLDPLPLWPLCLLVPAFLLLSLFRSKVPWVVIPLFPAWATLQGLSLAAILSLPGRFPAGKTGLPCLVIAFSACVMAASAYHVYGRDYETVLRATDEGQWLGASLSRDAAQLMNRSTRDGDRALVTSFHYWIGFSPGQPCPIFAYYFTNKVEVLIRPHDRSFQDLVADIREYRLDWALLSPEPGAAEDELFGGFEKKLGLKPQILPQAYLFHTSGLYESDADRKSNSGLEK